MALCRCAGTFQDPTANQFRTATCRKSLAEYMVPSTCVFSDELPVIGSRQSRPDGALPARPTSADPELDNSVRRV
jgi:hypothetical protein